ncbi:hypothetical protein B0H11DRAFT_2332077 [Mycena galericulata]|nr:hypothetical protein B0H11DRAFT_2332077 [Mycena galericulata]
MPYQDNLKTLPQQSRRVNITVVKKEPPAQPPLTINEPPRERNARLRNQTRTTKSPPTPPKSAHVPPQILSFVAHTAVYPRPNPGLAASSSKISYIDLAEQTLGTMEKISEEFPSSIVREGGLSALLLFSPSPSHAPRSAPRPTVAATSRPTPRRRSTAAGPSSATDSEQRLVEFACLCVTRVIDSLPSVKNPEALVDTDLIRAANLLLLPAGSPARRCEYVHVVHALASAARSSQYHARASQGGHR